LTCPVAINAVITNNGVPQAGLPAIGLVLHKESFIKQVNGCRSGAGRLPAPTLIESNG